MYHFHGAKQWAIFNKGAGWLGYDIRRTLYSSKHCGHEGKIIAFVRYFSITRTSGSFSTVGTMAVVGLMVSNIMWIILRRDGWKYMFYGPIIHTVRCRRPAITKRGILRSKFLVRKSTSAIWVGLPRLWSVLMGIFRWPNPPFGRFWAVEMFVLFALYVSWLLYIWKEFQLHWRRTYSTF